MGRADKLTAKTDQLNEGESELTDLKAVYRHLLDANHELDKHLRNFKQHHGSHIGQSGGFDETMHVRFVANLDKALENLQDQLLAELDHYRHKIISIHDKD